MSGLRAAAVGLLLLLGAFGLHAQPAPTAEQVRAALEAARAAAVAADQAASAAADARRAAEAAARSAAALQAALQAAAPSVAQAAAPAASAAQNRNSFLSYLSAGSQNNRAEIKYQLPNPDGPIRRVQTLSLSTPVAEKSKLSEPASLDGLANGTALGYTIQQLGLLPGADPYGRKRYGWGITGRVAYSTHKHFDSQTLAEGSSRRYSRSAAPFLSLDTGPNGWNFVVKHDWQRSFKDATSKTLCPEPTTFPVTCVNGAIGEPKLTRARIWSLSARHSSGSGLLDLAPTLSYDTVSKVKGVDLPMYFIKGSADSKKIVPFNAGVRLGWRSDTKEGTVAIFVGSDFDLYAP